MTGARMAVILGALAVTVAAARGGGRAAGGDELVAGEASAYYAAWSLYRSLAVWAGKRAMVAEIKYWEAVQP